MSSPIPSVRSSASLHRRAGLLAAAFLALPVLAPAETIDRIEKKLSARPGGNLVVDISGGRIEVTTAPGSEVSIDFERKISASSKEVEERYLADREVIIEQKGDTITIRQKKAESNWSLLKGWKQMRMKTDFRCRVVVPSKFNVDLDTSGGSIAVSDLEGSVVADTSGGSIKCTNIVGPVDADTSGGSITFVACRGDARADTSGGSINADDGVGLLNLDTSGGSIRVRNHRGDVDADTSGGSITVDSVTGNVNANTSGGSIRATMHAQPSGDCRLSTSGGGITVNLPKAAAVELDAAASGGGVRADFDVAGADPRKKTSHLRGAINGGGPLLYLRTSGGGITVSRSES